MASPEEQLHRRLNTDVIASRAVSAFEGLSAGILRSNTATRR